MSCGDVSAVPFLRLFGVLCLPPADVVSTVFWCAAAAALTVVLKRRSALRLGGFIHGYNQHQVRAAIANRRRRVRDMLNDPLLAKGMARRYGDLASLRESAAQWEADGLAVRKKDADECVKKRGKMTVPWISTMNIWLGGIFFVSSHFRVHPAGLFVWLLCLIHLVDNAVLCRALVSKVRGRGRTKSETDGEGAVAAVEGAFLSGPVPEVEVGMPVMRIVTV